MKMVAINRPQLELKEFLELVLIWHKDGDIPRNRCETQEFIESDQFFEFFLSVQHWCVNFGLKVPSRGLIVRVLHQLYPQ